MVKFFFLGNSLNELQWLLQNTNSTLTVWGQDQLNEDQKQDLKTLITSIGYNKIYLDVDADLRNSILQ